MGERLTSSTLCFARSISWDVHPLRRISAQRLPSAPDFQYLRVVCFERWPRVTGTDPGVRRQLAVFHVTVAAKYCRAKVSDSRYPARVRTVLAYKDARTNGDSHRSLDVSDPDDGVQGSRSPIEETCGRAYTGVRMPTNHL